MGKIRFYPFSDKTIQFAEPPKPTSKYTAEWYKKQPGQIDEKSSMANGVVFTTIKKCMPIFDMMTAGYVLAAPCDIFIDATDPNKLVYSVPQAMKQFQGDLFASHSPDQYSEYPLDRSKYHKDIIRLLPFWAVKTEKGTSSMFIQPQHGDDTPLTAFSAIVDTDTFMSDGHFSFLVEKDFKGIIKQGTPLLQVVPFRREAWSSEVVELEESENEFKKQRLSLRSTFLNAYKAKFRSKKEYR
jgi:hypothetical protein